MLQLVPGNPAGPALPSLTGTWRSWRAPAGTPLSIELTATDVDGEVSGHGEFAVGAIRGVPFALRGTHEHPTIHVTFHATGVEEACFGGRFVGTDAVHGRLTGSGFGGLPVVLRRT